MAAVGMVGVGNGIAAWDSQWCPVPIIGAEVSTGKKWRPEMQRKRADVWKTAMAGFDQEPSVANGRIGEVEKIDQAQAFYQTPGRSWPSYLSLLGHLQRVFNLNAQITHRTLQLCVPEKQLDGAEVLRPPVDQGGLGAAHRVRAVGRWIQTNFRDPSVKDSGILPCAEVR